MPVAIALAGWLALAASPLHAQQCTNDLQGADDEPGQKDLNQFCIVGTCGGSNTAISWNFDDTVWSGSNTGDGCALFDDNGDGNADRAVCVTIQGAAQIQPGDPKCYTCGNTRPDRCTNSALVACTTTCSVVLAADPFALDPNHVGNACKDTTGCPGSAACCRNKDAQVDCCLAPADAGSGGVMIDVCSYPSQQPNSDPSDCTINRQCSKSDPNDPVCDDSNPCTVDSCDTTFGVCRHVAGNPGAVCRAAAGACDVAETCTGTSIFCPPDKFAPQGGTCRNKSDDCDVAESCSGTSADCPPDGVAPQGTVCRPSSGNQCDVAEVCDGTTKACPPDGSQPDNTPCDDSNACTSGDKCVSGNCAGTPISCDDGNLCTTDSCDTATGCKHVNNNNPCDDKNACTTGDHCAGGSCTGGPPPNCDDNNVCTTDACNPESGCTHSNNTLPCDDDNACTTADTCSGGSCVGGPAPNCDDSNACTTDSCNLATGCVHDPVPLPCCNSDADCGDTDACTTNERCVNNSCVSDPVDCDDGNVCTTDSCDPASGCKHVNNNDPCDDGSACTTGDHCAGGSCAGGPPPDCNDDNVCTTDSCNPATGCTHANNTAPCDDGSACTSNDTCSGGSCVGGPAPNCDDSDVCTTDSCDPHSGCTHTNNSAPCDDGNPCTLNDFCSRGSCTPGPQKDCNDLNGCTDDTCNPSTGACEYLDNSAPCDDGNVCTVGDHCFQGSCQPGDPKDCNDGNFCTQDTCTPQTDCQHGPVPPGCCNTDADCKDTDACTVNERCVNNQCVSDPRDCSDSDPCTVDMCNNAGGGFLCVHTSCSQIDPQACPNSCTRGAPLCGNGIIDPGETCDPPGSTPISGVTCRTDCTYCGDGVVQAGDGEACDDGNQAGGCDKRGVPIDSCQNNCTTPICKDPTKVLLASAIDRFFFHGRLALTSTIDFANNSFVVELRDPSGDVIFRRSLPPGSIVSKSGTAAGPFQYTNAAASASGGISKLKIQKQKNQFYKATLEGYGNLLGSENDMATHIHAGDGHWTVTGVWQHIGNLWRLIPPVN